jgi:glycosyl hydrolase family 57
MPWAQFLHLYQPYYQQPDVLERIVGQCYRPLIEGLRERPEARFTLNVNAVLLELFDKYGYHDLIGSLAEMGQRGQIEFLASAKYHTLLPFLPAAEVERQIQINSEAARQFLGEAFRPRGIFLPEMAYNPELAPILEALGLEYVLLDELALDGHPDRVDRTKLYQIGGTKLKALFRQRRLSNVIMHRAVSTPAEFKEAAGDDIGPGRYLVTGMDGEVFGNWYPGYEQFLFALLADKDLGMVQAGELVAANAPLETVATVACSWADSQADLERGAAFFSWRDPDNPLQKLEWELQELALKEFANVGKDEPMWPELRGKLDPALASDVFYWSSAQPWWSIELIEEGAYGLAEVVESSPVATIDAKERAKALYHQIMDLAFWWRRSGKIAAITRERAEILRIPFAERADGQTYKAFVALLAKKEAEAAKRRDYEAAALWRDGILKLEQKRDIYDAYHVIDSLRAKVPNEQIEKLLAKYRQPYAYIRSGQPEQRSN